MDIHFIKTICPYCGTGCSLLLTVKNGRIVSTAPYTRAPVNNGNLCVRGLDSFQLVDHPDRLTTPFIRKNGELVMCSWDEVLSLVAKRLSDYKPEECCVLSSPRVSNEDNYVMMKFARGVLKTNHIDHCERLFHASIVRPLEGSFGYQAMTNSIEDISEAECIFIIGSNTLRQFPLMGRRIVMAKKHGAKVIYADPRATMTESVADLFLQFHSGTDVLLLNGLMQIILQNGWEDAAFIQNRTNGFETFRRAVMKPEYSLKNTEKTTRIPAEILITTAEWIAKRRCAVIYSTGIAKQDAGSDTIHALANLQMLTGNIGIPGTGVNPLRGQNNIQGACDMGIQPFYFTGYQKVTDPVVHQKFTGAWGFPNGISPAKTGMEVTEMLDTMIRHPGELKCMYILGENPLVSDADPQHASAALETLDFLVVQDILATETMKYADVVLPAVCFAERDGTVTNMERRVQCWHKASEGPADTKPDWEIISSIAVKMGYARQFAWQNTEEIFEEIAHLTPIYAGMTYKGIDTPDGMHWPCFSGDDKGTPVLYREKFATPDGKGQFIPVEGVMPAEKSDAGFPFIFSVGRSIFHWDVESMRRSVSVPRYWVEIHPDDADVLHITEGAGVSVATKEETFIAAAHLTREILPGTLFMPSHFVDASTNRLVKNVPVFGGRFGKNQRARIDLL